MKETEQVTVAKRNFYIIGGFATYDIFKVRKMEKKKHYRIF